MTASLVENLNQGAQHSTTGNKATVRGLAYVIVAATDLDAWEEFATGLLGLQISKKSAERLEFRMDEKEYRLVIEKSDRDGVSVAGWEVAGPSELRSLTESLRAAGYEVEEMTHEQIKARRITAGVSFDDPDKLLRLELHYGLRESNDRFVSPKGVTFVTGTGGVGHIFQAVNDFEAYEHLYFDLLGFRLSDQIETGPNLEIDLTFAHCNPRHHSYAFAHLPKVGSAIGHLMFEVDEIDIVGRAWDQVLEEKAAPVLSTLGKHTNDKMISFYVRSPSDFGIEYGTGGLLIDESTWVPTRYSAAHYWGHNKSRPVNPTDAAENS